jgi:AcrR family transcriptional regulator
LSAEEVLGSQRTRILGAMIEAVGEHGYAETTVGDAIAIAHVSRTAFYRLFENKADCFRAAYRGLTETLLTDLGRVGLEVPFVEAVRASVRTYLRWCREWENGARAWHLGITAVEPDGLALRDEALGKIALLFRAGGQRARRELRGLPPAREFMFDAAAHASVDLVSRYAREDRLARLDQVEDRLLYLWLLALADQTTAEAEVQPAEEPDP